MCAACCLSAGLGCVKEVLIRICDVIDIQHAIEMICLVLNHACIEPTKSYLPLYIPLVHVPHIDTRRPYHSASKAERTDEQ